MLRTLAWIQTKFSSEVSALLFCEVLGRDGGGSAFSDAEKVFAMTKIFDDSAAQCKRCAESSL